MGSWREDGGEHGALWLGVLLIVLGGLFLAGQYLDVDWDDYGWPLYVIVPGLVLFALGLAIPNEAGLGMTIPGGIITTVGLLLLYQSTYDAYSSWAYAWALVLPGSVGVSLLAYGLLHRKLDLVDAGLRVAAVGLGLFVGFGLFLENVVGLGDADSTHAMRTALPLLAVVLGGIIVLLSLVPRSKGRPDDWQSRDTWRQDPPSA